MGGFKNNQFKEMCSASEAGSYLRRIDSCITQLKAQGPSRTCNESKEEEEAVGGARPVHHIISTIKWIRFSTLSIKSSLSGVVCGTNDASPPNHFNDQVDSDQ